MYNLKPGITFRVTIKNDLDDSSFSCDFWYQSQIINEQVAFECIYEPKFTIHYEDNYWYLGWNNGEIKFWKKYIKNPEECKISDNFEYLLSANLLHIEFININDPWISCENNENVFTIYNKCHSEGKVLLARIYQNEKLKDLSDKQCFIEDYNFNEMNYLDSFDPYSIVDTRSLAPSRVLTYPNGWWFTNTCFSYNEDDFNFNYLTGTQFDIANENLLKKLGIQIDYQEEIEYKIISQELESLTKNLETYRGEPECNDFIVDTEEEISECKLRIKTFENNSNPHFYKITDSISIWNFNGNDLFIINYDPRYEINDTPLIYNKKGILIGRCPKNNSQLKVELPLDDEHSITCLQEQILSVNQSLKNNSDINNDKIDKINNKMDKLLINIEQKDLSIKQFTQETSIIHEELKTFKYRHSDLEKSNKLFKNVYE